MYSNPGTQSGGCCFSDILNQRFSFILGTGYIPPHLPLINIAKKLLSLEALSHSLDVPQKLLLFPVADTYEELNLSRMPTLIWGQKWPSKRGGRSVADPGDGPGGLGPPLFLDQKGPKIYFGNRVPPYLRVWIRHCCCREVSNKSQFMNFLFAGIMAIVER